MADPVIEPIGPHRNELGVLRKEIEALARTSPSAPQPGALFKQWASLIAGGTGFVLLDGSRCTGLLLYSAEYDLRFSSLLSASSAEKLPKSVTIFACHVLESAREPEAAMERLLVQSAVSRLRRNESIETIAFQAPLLYDVSIKKILADLGFLTCRRAHMERSLNDDIPHPDLPPGLAIEPADLHNAEAVRSVISNGYFAEIDGYLFPDIAAVCSRSALFREFLASPGIDRPASVLARMHGHPCGCVLVLADGKPGCGLIGVVAVIPTMRRRGIAHAMLAGVLRWLKDHGHRTAALAVTLENRQALRLYSMLGFEESAPRTSISVWRRSVSRPRLKTKRRQ
jgi:GNAT superfamily N-acetyltransferase